MPTSAARIRTYGRTGGRHQGRHQRAMDEHGARHVLEVPRGETYASVAAGYRLDQEQVYGRRAPWVVEIGSGAGAALLHAATEHPEVDFLGVEVYRPGVAQTVAGLHRHGLTNVRVVQADAHDVLTELVAPGALAEVWTFFPDPWPKSRHRKRRLIDAEFADLVASSLQPDGQWRLATDWADYAERIRAVADGCAQLVNLHAEAAGGGYAPRYEGRPVTKFERKGTNAGRRVFDLTYRRAET